MQPTHGWPEVLALLLHNREAYTQRIRTTTAPLNGSRARKALGKGIIMNVARSFNNWRKYRQTVTELGRMTSRELRDLGIDRADIHSIARASVAR